MNVESAEVALAYTYAWWLTGSEQAARSAVLAAVGRPDVPGADPQLRIEILLRRVRAAAVSAPTMCPASELALLHDAIGIGLDSAAGLAHIDAREARTELAHGRLEALGPEAQFEITHPERLGGLAVGNPADVAAARQNESLAHLREMILTGRDELIGLAQIDVPQDLLDTVARQQLPRDPGKAGTHREVESEPLEPDWFNDISGMGSEASDEVGTQDGRDVVHEADDGGLDPDEPADAGPADDGPADDGLDDQQEEDAPGDRQDAGSSEDVGTGLSAGLAQDPVDEDLRDGAPDVADGQDAGLEQDHEDHVEHDAHGTHEERGGDDEDADDGYGAVEDEVGGRDDEEIDFTGVTDAPELGTPGIPRRRAPWGWIAVLFLIAVLVGLYLWRTSNNTSGEADSGVSESAVPADADGSEPAVADNASDAAPPAVDQNGSEQPASPDDAAAVDGSPDATASEQAPLSDFVLTQAGVAVGIGSDPDFDNPAADPFDPISVTIEYEGAEADDALIADWTVDGEPFGTERADLSPGLDTTRFTRQVPQDGWPSGQHTLELTLERTGEVVGTAQFEVTGGPSLDEQQASEGAEDG